MIARRTVTLAANPVLSLPAHLIEAELIEHHDDIGDCPPCWGTGTVVILMCLAGTPYTPVKDCVTCAGTGWLDKIERTPRVPATHHHLPL